MSTKRSLRAYWSPCVVRFVLTVPPTLVLEKVKKQYLSVDFATQSIPIPPQEAKERGRRLAPFVVLVLGQQLDLLPRVAGTHGGRDGKVLQLPPAPHQRQALPRDTIVCQVRMIALYYT